MFAWPDRPDLTADDHSKRSQNPEVEHGILPNDKFMSF